MTTEHTLLWTPIPAGLNRQGQLMLSLVLSPRITWTDGAPRLPLGDVSPPFLDWPKTLAPVAGEGLVATLKTDDGLESEVVFQPRTVKLYSSIWKAIFTEQRPVEVWRLPHGRRSVPVEAVNSKEIDQLVRAGYREAVVAYSSDAPGLSGIHQVFKPVVEGIASSGLRGRVLAAKLAERAAALESSESWEPTEDLAPAVRRYDELVRRFPDAAIAQWELAQLDPVIREPAGGGFGDGKTLGSDELEFHEIVSLLGRHPTLLRMLGLVLDYVAEPVDLPIRGWLEVDPPRPLPDATSLLPRVRFDGTGFRAASSSDDSPIERGWLRVNDTARFSVTSHDARETLAALATTIEAGNDDTVAPPTLRTRGLAVTWADRAAWIQTRTERAFVMQERVEAGKPVELYAEDLVRGFAVDVRRDSGPWRSISARTGEYRHEASSHPVTLDWLPIEDAVDDLRGKTVSGGDFSQAVVDARLFHWKGWSLAVPPPGRPMNAEGTAAEQPSDVLALGIASEFRVPPGTLPSLRFGATYEFRGRVVDLAGNAIALGVEDTAPVTTAVEWQRTQAVPPPQVLDAADENGDERPDYGPGSHANRLVIRSYMDEQGQVTDHEPLDQRWFAPPRAGVELVEAHGRLDGIDDRDAYTILSTRDGGAALAPPVAPGALGPSLDRLLPDPLAYELRLYSIADAPLPAPGSWQWGGEWGRQDWHDIASIGVELHSDDPSPTSSWDEQRRVVRVGLPIGTKARYTYHSAPTDADFEALAPYQWLKEGDGSKDRDRIRSGGHWAICPTRLVELVHASQRPVLSPHAQALSVSRELDQTTASFTWQLSCHAESSGEVWGRATWEEPELQPNTEAGVEWHIRRLPILRRPVPDSPSTNDQLVLYHATDEFGDTRRRDLTVQCVARSRYADCFDGELDHTRVGNEVEIILPNSGRPPTLRIAEVVPSFKHVGLGTPGDGSSRARRVAARVLLGEDWFATGAGEQLAVVVDDTRWGRDPIHTGPATDPVSLQSFPNRATARASVMRDADDSDTVTIAIYDVHWDRERRHWYADIEVDPGTHWRPFIQLAVARYQPKSLVGHHLSEVVMTEPFQLAPARQLDLESVDNPHYGMALRCFELRLRAEVGGAAAASNPDAVFEVEVQRQIEPGVWLRSVAASSDVLAGQGHVAYDSCQIDHLVAASAELLHVRVCVPQSVPSADYRVVVREYEPHPLVSTVGSQFGLEVYMDSVGL